MIIAITSDVFSKEKIEESAHDESKLCLVLSDEDTLWAAMQEETPNAIFLEIGTYPLDGAELIQKLRRNPSTRNIPIVVFGNSLRADLLQDAKEAGADLALPKSAFQEQLPELIRHFTKPSSR